MQIDFVGFGYARDLRVWNNSFSIPTIAFSHLVIAAIPKAFCLNAFRFAQFLKAVKALCYVLIALKELFDKISQLVSRLFCFKV